MEIIEVDTYYNAMTVYIKDEDDFYRISYHDSGNWRFDGYDMGRSVPVDEIETSNRPQLEAVVLWVIGEWK